MSAHSQNTVKIVSDPTRDEVYEHRNLVRNFEDVPVVLAAVKARVDYLVSTDTDLTDVGDSTEGLRHLLIIPHPPLAGRDAAEYTMASAGMTRA